MTARETPTLISDTVLATLAHPANTFQRENCTTHMLQSLAAELAQWRRAAKDTPDALSLALRSEAIVERLEQARNILRSDTPDFETTLHDACETILRHSTFAEERAAAQDILAQIKRAA